MGVRPAVQAVNYTDQLLPGSEEESDNMLGVTETGTGYALSSALEEQQQHQKGRLSATVPFSEPSPYSSEHFSCPSSYCDGTCEPMSPDSVYAPKSKQYWPSPPLAPGDFEASYENGDPPTSGGEYPGYCQASPDSLSEWSPPDPITYPPADWAQHQPPSAYRICSPESVEDMSTGGSEFSTPYSRSYYGNYEHDRCIAPNAYSSPSLSQGYGPGLFESAAPSPRRPRGMTPSLRYSRDDSSLSEVDPVLGKAYTSTRSCDDASRTSNKTEEPYAKLIYRAFMSQPDHCMTLQDIYQWFRDNTTKAVNEKGGWQNSIRHNLSMNAAFSKRDRRQEEEVSATPAERPAFLPSNEPRRTNEWVLEEWAVREGVQSTTRYRKGNAARKGVGAKSLGSHPHGLGRSGHQNSTKALSGRKSGCVTRNSKQRERNLTHSLAMAMLPNAHAHPALEQVPYPMAPRGEMYSSDSPSPAPVSVKQQPQDASSDAGSADCFGLMMSEPPLGVGPADGGVDESGGASPASAEHHGLPIYVRAPSSQFPYDIPEAHLGVSNANQAALGNGGPARLFDAVPSGLCGWSNNSSSNMV